MLRSCAAPWSTRELLPYTIYYGRVYNTLCHYAPLISRSSCAYFTPLLRRVSEFQPHARLPLSRSGASRRLVGRAAGFAVDADDAITFHRYAKLLPI